MKILIIIVTFIANLINAQSFYEHRFHPTNNLGGQTFGSEVILNDSMIFISAHRDYIFGENSGSLYYYKKNNNVISFVKKIFPEDGYPGATYGLPYIYGDRLYVRSINYFFGKVYEYKYNNGDWVEINQIKPSRDSVIFGHGVGFGYSCVRNNNELFVGADFDARYKPGGGSVYHYFLQDTVWKLRRIMYPKYKVSDANFGNYLSFNYENNLLIISAPSDSNEFGRYSGNVYIYEKVDSLWETKQILSPTEGDPRQAFGTSVSTSADYLFVGAPGGGSSISGGVVYIYRYINNHWQLRNKIVSPINSDRDYFGYSLSFYHGKLLIGAPGEERNGQRRSFAYLYQIDGDSVKFLYKFQPANSHNGDRFGVSVSAIGDEYLIGAYWMLCNGIETGGAILYSLKPLSNTDRELDVNQFKLNYNYPNPFNPSTKISWQSPVSGHTTLKVYDVMGREVATLVDEFRESGSYEIEFPNVETGHAPSLPSGVYFYRLQVGDYIETKKMMLLK